MIWNPAIRAIFKRDMRRWFSNPAGYVFIALFVAASAAALFLPSSFFQNNLANLETINDYFRILLLFFVPAVTMSVWAGERANGTDELLLTLPATDTQIILGKYLAAAGIYTVSLLFTLPLLAFLWYLGSPDWGLILSNYVGFWLLGLMLISAGMVGSQLFDNSTLAFIVGAIFCGLIVISEDIIHFFAPELARTWTGYGPISQFRDFALGKVSISGLLLFGGLTLGFLYLNHLLLSRRHWAKGSKSGLNMTIRFVCLLIAAVAITAIGANTGARADLTVERIHSLSEESQDLIGSLDPERPVFIQAYLSPDMPRDFVQTKRNLLNLLREFDEVGGDNIRVRIVETERYSDEAREAETKFDIRPRPAGDMEGGTARRFDVFMGIAFTCGLDQVVIPFMEKGLSVEYELTRSIRTVASSKRRKVGIVDTDIKVFGGFEFQSMRQDPQWAIVRELQLQYDVERVAPDSEYPADLDALIVPMPSTLTQPQMATLESFILSGKPTLLIDDPFPVSSMGNAPTDPKGGQQNPMMGQQPPPEPKGDIRGMLSRLGIRWPYTDIVWDTYNPHPEFNFEPEMVVVGASSSSSMPFNPDETITSGLQEVLNLFGGHFMDQGREGISLVPLLKTTPVSGTLNVNNVFTSNFFGGRSLNPGRQWRSDGMEKILACRVVGKTEDMDNAINVVALADLDMISDQFFAIRAQAIAGLLFDNVTFLLNCVDFLVGDESYIDLRKKRPKHRTLTTLEAQEEVFNEEWLDAKRKAESEAEDKLAKARQSLNERVAKIEERTDLDERSKQIQVQSARDVEQRRLDVQTAAIEDEKNRAIDLAETKKRKAEERIRGFYKLGGLLIAPIPAILFGIFSFLRRRSQESSVKRQAPLMMGGGAPHADGGQS